MEVPIYQPAKGDVLLDGFVDVGCYGEGAKARSALALLPPLLLSHVDIDDTARGDPSISGVTSRLWMQWP